MIRGRVRLAELGLDGVRVIVPGRFGVLRAMNHGVEPGVQVGSQGDALGEAEVEAG
jgi:hypothetical protein